MSNHRHADHDLHQWDTDGGAACAHHHRSVKQRAFDEGRDQGKLEGYKSGYQDGYHQGFIDGRESNRSE